MLAMDVQVSDEHMTVLFDEFDTNGDKLMDFATFLHLVDECLAGSDVDSQSSRSSSSESFSQLSSDSQALRKHPLILQVSVHAYDCPRTGFRAFCLCLILPCKWSQRDSAGAYLMTVQGVIFVPSTACFALIRADRWQVQAKEGNILGKAPEEGFMPYLVLTYGNIQKSTSSIQRKTSRPVWNENFVFKVSDLSVDVVVKCYHWNGRNEGPGPFLGMAEIKVANLLAGFEGSETSSSIASSTDLGSGSGPVNRGKYLGHSGAPSPLLGPQGGDVQVGSQTGSSPSKQSPSPATGRSTLRTGALPSSIQSTPGRGMQRRAAMKQKGRVHKHGRLRLQESQKWYAFTDAEGRRIGGGSGIRIRLRPWAPKGTHAELRRLQQVEIQSKQKRAGSGILSLFAFGRQPKNDFSDSDESGSSLSTLAESEDELEYSSPDEIENEEPPNWSRKPAHVLAPNEMTGIYKNLFGDQTLEEQLRHLERKQREMHFENANQGKIFCFTHICNNGSNSNSDVSKFRSQIQTLATPC